ncbi:hypothetical protein JZO70_07465 [Enterococcus sp. 669A]|uniref:Uncharacterized protein n=1 Tax=Candidatus Enterococcus moelleringii TaxID=2815325 RepID=A0ABS3L8N4_9ENTE|nr:hypothetical protein [Enterococcus sp. 669A]MBO1305993.1 hypothetical protein [Enterococcus sp. 669A]
MKTVLLQQHQLLKLKRKTLNKRFFDHYQEHKDAAYILQAAVMVMVRNFFSFEDLSFVAEKLIRELFMDKPAELVSVRHLSIYFREYFNAEEWDTVISSLYANHDEYLKLTENARLHTEHIRPLLHAGTCEVETPKDLALTFFDAAGKKHRCTIKNVHRSYSAEENCAALSILGTLTIFEKDRVRRFTRLAKSRFITAEDDYDCDNNEEQPEPAVKTDLQQPAEKPKHSLYLDDPRPLPKNFDRPANFEGTTYADWKKFLLEGIDLSTISEKELISRTATALYDGVQVKDARANFQVDEESEEDIDELDGEWVFNLEAEIPQPKNNSETDTAKADTVDPEKARLEEIRRQREQKQKQQRIDKALQRKGKGGKKGKNGKGKKR